ncbi:MAG: HEAT repeat domain-containing protein [Actinomycetota bacterium]|nr:HEAT repeat domain-containing protein [Actinomycetota bacterium]
MESSSGERKNQKREQRWKGDIRTLSKLLEIPVEEQKAAVQAIAKKGGKSSETLLCRVLDHRKEVNPEVRAEALEALEFVIEAKDYIELLERYISGENPKVQRVARRNLARLDSSGFPSKLLARECADQQAIKIYGASHTPGADIFLERFIIGAIERGDVTHPRKWGRIYVSVRSLGKMESPEAPRIMKIILDEIESIHPSDDLAKKRLEMIGRAAGDILSKTLKF